MNKALSFLKKHSSKVFNYSFVSFFLIVFGAIFIANGGSSRMPIFTPNMLTQIAYTMILVLSLNLVVGFLGELSLGHAGFMYIGAYVGGLFSYYTTEIITNNHLRLILTIIIGGAVAAMFGFLVGLPALRLRGDYLAIVTLAFGEIVRGVLKNIKIEGVINTPADGFTLPRYKELFIVAFIVVLITLFCIQNLVNSKHGRAVTAIRDNEIAARSMGINITFYKLAIFSISAFFAGVAGAIYSNYALVGPATFDYNYSIEILVMVVLGGMGSLSGSLISSLLIVFINVKLQSYLTGTLAGAKYLVYAIILIIMMIVSSSPKLATFREKLNWKYISGKIFKKKSKKPNTAEEVK